jgi:hypothetical protein
MIEAKGDGPVVSTSFRRLSSRHLTIPVRTSINVSSVGLSP